MTDSTTNEKQKTSKAPEADRGDAADVGVPMLEGDGSEPQGPEDALGPGPKRGDYSGRVGPGDYQPHQVVPVPDAKPGEPKVRVVAQRDRADEQGEVAGEKGGVTTGESGGSTAE